MNHVCSDLSTLQNWHNQESNKTGRMNDLRQDPFHPNSMPSSWTTLKKAHFQLEGEQSHPFGSATGFTSPYMKEEIAPPPAPPTPQTKLCKPRPRRSSEILHSPRRKLLQGAERPNLPSVSLYTQSFALCSSIDSELGLLATSSSCASVSHSTCSLSDAAKSPFMSSNYLSSRSLLSSELYMDNDPEVESMTTGWTKSLHLTEAQNVATLLQDQDQDREKTPLFDFQSPHAHTNFLSNTPSSAIGDARSVSFSSSHSPSSLSHSSFASPEHSLVQPLSSSAPNEQQAIVLTDARFVILDMNAHVSTLLGHPRSHLVGVSAYSLFVPLYRKKIEKALMMSSLSTTAAMASSASRLLFVGKMMRVCKANGTTVSVSVWMKEYYEQPPEGVIVNHYETSKKICMILKDITEKSLTFGLDEQAHFIFKNEKDAETFDYLFGAQVQSIFQLIPSLEKRAFSNPQKSFCPRLCSAWLVEKRFLTAKTIEGHMMPMMLSQSMTNGEQMVHSMTTATATTTTPPLHPPLTSLSESEESSSMDASANVADSSAMPTTLFLELISLRNISGVIKISASGLIKSCSTTFTKYLFGYSATQLKNKMSITNLLPEYFEYFEKWKHRSRPPTLSSFNRNPTLNALESSFSSSSSPNAAAIMSRSLNTSPVYASSSHLISAYHADGSNFPCHIEIFPSPSEISSSGSKVRLAGAQSIANIVPPYYALRIQYSRPHRLISNKASRPSHFRESDRREGPTQMTSLTWMPHPCSPPPSPTCSSRQKVSEKPTEASSQPLLVPNLLTLANAPSHQMTPPDILALLESPPSSYFPSPHLLPLSIGSYGQSPQSSGSLFPSLRNNPYLIGEAYFPSQLSDYRILKRMGEGAYGSVHLAVIRKDPLQRKLVIKYVVKSRILPDGWTELPLCRLPPESKAYHPFARTLLQFPLEIHLLDSLRKSPHPCLMELLHFFEDESHYYIVSELFGQGLDLFDFIDQTTQLLPPRMVQKIFWQIVKAVTHLQGCHMLHRDIKDENIIIDSECHVKLIDFGSAAFYTPGKRLLHFCGTIDYAAPEVLRGRGYEGPPQEVWALGILLYTLLYKENPFRNMDEILTSPIRLPRLPTIRESQGQKASLTCYAIQLVKWMLQKEPNQRPTLEQILNHPYLNLMHMNE